MNKRIYYIVNGITFYRTITAPLLIFLIIYKQMDWFKWLLALTQLVSSKIQTLSHGGFHGI
ncbi:MAG TPA: hypothetical protein VMU83_15195 [Hanamia sp.]|nr:hypothetical protein [Hanamia sp.]